LTWICIRRNVLVGWDGKKARANQRISGAAGQHHQRRLQLTRERSKDPPPGKLPDLVASDDLHGGPGKSKIFSRNLHRYWPGTTSTRRDVPVECYKICTADRARETIRFYDSETVLPGFPGPACICSETGLTVHRRPQHDMAVPTRREKQAPDPPTFSPFPPASSRPSGIARPLGAAIPSGLVPGGGPTVPMKDGDTLESRTALKVLQGPHHQGHLIWSSISEDSTKPYAVSRETLCSMGTSVVPDCRLRSDGQPTTSAPTSTTHAPQAPPLPTDAVYPRRAGSLCRKQLSDTVRPQNRST
jgi:hypothetical protein